MRRHFTLTVDMKHLVSQEPFGGPPAGWVSILNCGFWRFGGDEATEGVEADK